MRPLIYFDKVTVEYEGHRALDEVTFRVDEPAFITVLGPNGAGKTTLLKAALGLVEPVSGRIVVLGKDVLRHKAEVRKMVGYVPQRERLDPTLPMLVKDVVLMGRTVKRGPGRVFTKEDIEKAKEALERVGMLEHWNEPFSILSGGQQQRVLIARALACEPKLLLLDEPLSAVDAPSQEVILETLRKAVDEGIGVIMVTHDINPIIDLTDYVLLLNKRVIAFGKPGEKVREDLLGETFGRPVRVVRIGGTCYVIGCDAHA